LVIDEDPLDILKWGWSNFVTEKLAQGNTSLQGTQTLAKNIMESKKLMKELMEYHLKTTQAIEDILRSYLFTLHDHKDLLQKAIELLDDIEIVKIESQTTKRHFWMMTDLNKRMTYRVLDSYCPCREYLEQIQLVGREDTLCPHLIAIFLGTSLKKIEARSFGNEDFVKMLSEC
jgi:predicted nucleic acid-binding Zn finger protein